MIFNEIKGTIEVTNSSGSFFCIFFPCDSGGEPSFSSISSEFS